MLISLSLLGRSSALGARLKIRQHYSSPLAFGGNNSSSLGGRGFSALPRWATPSRHQGLEVAWTDQQPVVKYDPKLFPPPLMRCLMERAELVAQALVFLVRLTGEDVPLDEALNALSALAEQFQSGAIVGGTLIDSSS